MVFKMVSEKMPPSIEAVGRAWLWFRHRFSNVFCVNSSHLEVVVFADNDSSIAPKPCRFMWGTASSSALQLLFRRFHGVHVFFFFFQAWNIQGLLLLQLCRCGVSDKQQ